MSLALKACLSVDISYTQQPRAHTSDWSKKYISCKEVLIQKYNIHMKSRWNQIPCGCKVYWRRAQGSCSKACQSACSPCHSGSPTLVRCQGPQLWWYWFLSERCSVFSGPGEECSAHEGTEKAKNILNMRFTLKHMQKEIMSDLLYLEGHGYLDKPLHHLPLR